MASAKGPDDFTIWAPIEIVKAGEDGGDGRIRGIASSERVDQDGEVIDQRGIDWSLCKAIHLNHPINALTLIGEVDQIEPPRELEDGALATPFSGQLYMTDRLAKAVWNKMGALKKASSGMRLGISIEGKARKRDPDNPKRIVKSIVHSLAVDAAPRNRDAWLEPIAAGLSPMALSQYLELLHDPLAALESPTDAALRSGLILAEALKKATPPSSPIAVGYPSQAQGMTGGLSVAVPQSIEGGRRSKPPRLDPGYLDGMTNLDLMVTRVLKRLAAGQVQLTWDQGVAIVAEITRKPINPQG